MKLKDAVDNLKKQPEEKKKKWQLEWLDELEKDYKRRGLNKDFFVSENQYKNFIEKYRKMQNEA